MNSVWRSLLWKEWREHRPKAGLLLAACVVLPLGCVIAFWNPPAFVGGVAVMIGVCVPAVAVFLGAALGAGEQSRRTAHFLQALPAPLWKAALAKLIAGSITVLAPALIAATLVLAIWAFQIVNELYIKPGALLFALGIVVLGLTAWSLLVWSAAVGVNHSDELRAGAVALLVMASVWAVFTLGMNLTAEKWRPWNSQGEWPEWAAVTAAGAPGGVSYRLSFNEGSPSEPNVRLLGQRAWPYAAVFLGSHGLLATWYVARFGRRAKPQAAGTGVVVTTAAAPGWLAPPRRNRFTAIVWKQFRESAPLAGLGAVAIFIVGLICARASGSATRAETLAALGMSSMTVWSIAGVFVAIVAGIGLFYDDLRPGLHTFWRSRPIPVDRWFWTKLLTGLAITVGVLALGPLASLAVVKAFGGPVNYKGDLPPLAEYLGVGAGIHALAFLLATLAIIVLRQPVIAAIATFAVGLGLVFCVGTFLDSLGIVTNAQVATVLTTALVGLATIASLTAWKALRRDWGWKG